MHTWEEEKKGFLARSLYLRACRGIFKKSSFTKTSLDYTKSPKQQHLFGIPECCGSFKRRLWYRLQRTLLLKLVMSELISVLWHSAIHTWSDQAFSSPFSEQAKPFMSDWEMKVPNFHSGLVRILLYPGGKWGKKQIMFLLLFLARHLCFGNRRNVPLLQLQRNLPTTDYLSLLERKLKW